MGVLTASPEVGNTSVNVIPHMKKHSANSDDPSKSFVSAISEKSATNQSPLRSATNYNISNKDSCHRMILMENGFLNKMSTSSITESCHFPYYRSNNRDGSRDTVLVKDVGISCMLLKQNMSEITMPETGSLINHLKQECCDLSNITNKISTYTKDILNCIAVRKQRRHRMLKDLVLSKHTVSSQYIDNKGNVCLKLRLLNNAQTQCISQQAVIDASCKDKHARKGHCDNSKSCKLDGEEVRHEKNTPSKSEKYVQATILRNNVDTNTSTSSLRSTSSLYNCLLTKKNNQSNEPLNYTLLNVDNTQKYRDSIDHGVNNNSKDNLKRSCPIVFTNWREISQSKNYRNQKLATNTKELQEMMNTRNKTYAMESFNSNAVNHVPDTKFQTVKIRIIKQDAKH